MSDYKPMREWAEEWLKDEKSLYIGGRWVRGHGPRFASMNPATGETNGYLIAADEGDVDAAVAAARDAFDKGPWGRSISHKERSRIMHAMSDLIRAHVSELGTIETLDNGKLFTEACEDAVDVADFFDYYAGWTDKFYGEVNPVSNGYFSYTKREPVGVCGQIIPWNYPLDMSGYKLAPCLAMGNTLIIKPSGITSFSLVRMFEIFDESKLLPAGVVNLVVGRGSVGSLLTRHPKVDKVAFTGSTAVGRQLVHDRGLQPQDLEPRAWRQVAQYHFRGRAGPELGH